MAKDPNNEPIVQIGEAPTIGKAGQIAIAAIEAEAERRNVELGGWFISAQAYILPRSGKPGKWQVEVTGLIK